MKDRLVVRGPLVAQQPAGCICKTDPDIENPCPIPRAQHVIREGAAVIWSGPDSRGRCSYFKEWWRADVGRMRGQAFFGEVPIGPVVDARP